MGCGDGGGRRGRGAGIFGGGGGVYHCVGDNVVFREQGFEVSGVGVADVIVVVFFRHVCFFVAEDCEGVEFLGSHCLFGLFIELAMML